MLAIESMVWKDFELLRNFVLDLLSLRLYLNCGFSKATIMASDSSLESKVMARS